MEETLIKTTGCMDAAVISSLAVEGSRNLWKFGNCRILSAVLSTGQLDRDDLGMIQPLLPRPARLPAAGRRGLQSAQILSGTSCLRTNRIWGQILRIVSEATRNVGSDEEILPRCPRYGRSGVAV